MIRYHIVWYMSIIYYYDTIATVMLANTALNKKPKDNWIQLSDIQSNQLCEEWCPED